VHVKKKVEPNEWFYRLIRVVLYSSYRLRFRFKYFGSENVPGSEDPRGVILAPNHASYIDPPIMGISLKRRVTYLAKEYLFSTFFVGWVLRMIGALPIKGEAHDFSSIRGLIRILNLGRCIVVFPEGTRSEDGRFKEPEGGIGFLAVKSGAWVVPVYIHGSYEAFPKGVKWPRRKPVEVHYGKPFIPANQKELLAGDEPYLAISRKIMADIAKLKENVERQSVRAIEKGK